MSRRVVFCANQVSVCLADALVRLSSPTDIITVIYNSSRCDVAAFPALQNCSFPISKFLWFFLFIKSIFFRPDEVIVPHLRWRLASLFITLGRKWSLIDDGLDTFRNSPRNIDISKISENKNFYTFRNVEIADWLSPLNIVCLCGIENLTYSAKEVLDFSRYDTIVIESPGVHGYLEKHTILEANTFFIVHSNSNKNIHVDFKFDSIVGNQLALEASIKSFKGKIIVGESMVAVYLMGLLESKFTVELCIKEGNLINLSALVSMAKKCTNVSIHLIKES